VQCRFSQSRACEDMGEGEKRKPAGADAWGKWWGAYALNLPLARRHGAPSVHFTPSSGPRRFQVSTVAGYRSHPDGARASLRRCSYVLPFHRHTPAHGRNPIKRKSGRPAGRESISYEATGKLSTAR
jgi:hypothetical protein